MRSGRRSSFPKAVRSVSTLRLNEPERALLPEHSSGTLKGVVAAAFALALIAAPASAQTTTANAVLPGLAFKAASASDAACISVTSYGRIQNTCSTPRLVVAASPIGGAGLNPAVGGNINIYSVTNVFANNTWCQVVATNGVGNENFETPRVTAIGTGYAFHQLVLGWMYLPAEDAVVEQCELGPGDQLLWVEMTEGLSL